MDKRTVRANRGVYVRWDRRHVLQAVTELTCPNDGTLMYQGPKPKFSAVSCPTCKQVFPVKRD